jgi:hypothetical protein
VQTIVNLPDPLFRKSVAIAASRGETVEQLIVEAITREVDAHNAANTYGNAEVALPVLSSRRPGTLDLAEFDFDDLLA